MHAPVSAQTLIVPVTLTEPGPGRSTLLSTSPDPVAGTQRLPASDVEKAEGPPRSGTPVWVIVRASNWPKAPGTF